MYLFFGYFTWGLLHKALLDENVFDGLSLRIAAQVGLHQRVLNLRESSINVIMDLNRDLFHKMKGAAEAGRSPPQARRLH